MLTDEEPVNDLKLVTPENVTIDREAEEKLKRRQKYEKEIQGYEKKIAELQKKIEECKRLGEIE